MRVLGIDEAGRGSVLGPLVVAGYVQDSDVRDDADLVTAGAGDSKTMTAARREAVRARLEVLGTGDPRPVDATAIDQGNLNHLEEAVIVELVRTWRPDRIVVDALGHPRTLPAIVERLLTAFAAFEVFPEMVMEPKADAHHPVCGAASIFAKTTRDRLVADLHATWGDFGSGYPHDPRTRAWLAAHAATGEPWPPFVRTRWSTVTTIAQAQLF